jgi:hypothetical protein
VLNPDRARHGVTNQVVKPPVNRVLPHFSRSKGFLSCTPTRGVFSTREIATSRRVFLWGAATLRLSRESRKNEGTPGRDMPDHAPIVALRAGNRRGTVICSCLPKRRRPDFLLARIPPHSEGSLAGSSMSEKLTEAKRIECAGGTSFHSPKWMNCLEGVRFQVRLPCGTAILT